MRSWQLLLMLLFFSCSFEESIKPGDTDTFIKFFGVGEVNNAVYAEPTLDGGFICAGTTGSEGSENIYLFKTNSNGDLQWERNIGGLADDTCVMIRQHQNGSYLFLRDSTTGPNRKNIFIGTISADGREISYQTPVNNTDTIFNIQPIAFSISSSNGNLNILTGINNKSLLLNFDPLSEETRIITDTIPENDLNASIVEAGQGKIVIGGSSLRTNRPDSDILLMVVDENSQTLVNYTNVRKEQTNETGKHVTRASFGIACIGTTFEESNSNIRVITTSLIDDNFGAMQEITIENPGDDIGEFIHSTSDGNLVILSTSNSYGINKGNEVVLHKINRSGARIWSSPFVFGGSEDDKARVVFETRDGSLMIFATINTQVNTMMALIKINANGKI